ncbi:MAG: hypothetical protein AAGC70_08960 [Pseudomonadota bacterium]
MEKKQLGDKGLMATCARKRANHYAVGQRLHESLAEIRRHQARIQQQKDHIEGLRDDLSRSQDTHEQAEIRNRIKESEEYIKELQSKIETENADISLYERQISNIVRDFREEGCHEYYPLEV